MLKFNPTNDGRRGNQRLMVNQHGFLIDGKKCISGSAYT